MLSDYPVNSPGTHNNVAFSSSPSVLSPSTSAGNPSSPETIGVTGNHPFWSLDRAEFVLAGELVIGERLQTLSGATKWVQQKLPRPGPEPVYNLEVQGEHVYYVGNSGVLAHNASCWEQPRNSRGQSSSKTNAHQRIPGSTAVDDFMRAGRNNGYDVIGREISVRTPFGRRTYDVVIRCQKTGRITGVEVKSSKSSNAAFIKFGAPERQQFAADRYLRQQGGLEATGKYKGLFIEDCIKIQWSAL